MTIDEVESGLKCDCVCPACNNRLIARKGEVNSHHFAHYKSEDCLSGLETVLHKSAKEFLLKSKIFKTPILYYPNTDYEIFDEKEILIDNVILEKKIGEFIPDIIIETKGKKLLIEIVVTNPISWQKINRIKVQNLPVIEINAKYLFKHFYIKQDFKFEDNSFFSELLLGTKYKNWIHNPKIKTINQILKNNYAELKMVKSFKPNQYENYYYVEDCPIEKRFWKKGRNVGKPYASVIHDCNSCKFCNTVDYIHVPNKKYPNLEYSIPETVYCLGYLESDLRMLLKQIV